jgi:membrane-associated protein
MGNWSCVMPAGAVLAPAAAVLLAESRLLLGLVLPAASLVIALGVLAGVGIVPAPAAVVTVTLATVLGAALAHRAVEGGDADPLVPVGGRLRRVLPPRVVGFVDGVVEAWAAALGRRPVGAAALAQWVTGARTLAPRLAARAGVPLGTMLRGTIPAAILWSSVLVTAGAIGGTALQVARGPVAVAGIFILLLAGWFLGRRRRSGLPGSVNGGQRPSRPQQQWRSVSPRQPPADHAPGRPEADRAPVGLR